MRLVADDPARAAAEMDKLADELKRCASSLRDNQGMRDPGGMCDKVRIVLRGPNGEVKQDTGA